jgi:hypothetical protein
MFIEFECRTSARLSFLNLEISLHQKAHGQFRKATMKPKRNFQVEKVGRPKSVI